MKRLSETFVAAAAFVTALGGTLIGLPLVLGAPAMAASEQGMDRPGDHRQMPSERIEARLAYIKTALKITDAQTAQWNAVADVLRQRAKDADKAIVEMRKPHDENLSMIDRLEKHQKMMATQAASLQDFLTAARPLYASLSADQKKSADELLAHRFGGGRWGRHAGPGHEGWGREGWDHGGMGPGGMHRPGTGPDGEAPKP